MKNQRTSLNKIQIWVSDEQSKKIKSDCEKLNYSNKSQFIRDKLNDDFIYVNMFREIVYLYKKQGNNINQIAKHLNTYDKVEHDELKNALDKIHMASLEILNLIQESL